MQRIIGAVLIIAACSGIGFYEGRQLTGHERLLQQIRQMVILLRGEIRYGNSSLFLILGNIMPKLEAEISVFLCGLRDKMESKDYLRFYDIFLDCAQRSGIQKKLSDREWQHFTDFGKQLGCTDRETQLSQIELYLEELEYELAELGSEVKEKKKLYQNLGILCGFFLVLILW